MIEHEGVVSNIEGNSIFVELNVRSACASCHAKSACGIDNKTKIVEVATTDNSYSVGDSVNVLLRESLGMKAIFLAYVLPFFILVTTLIFFLQALKFSEGMSAVIAISILIPYYVVLYLLRGKLKKKFDFRIEKI